MLQITIKLENHWAPACKSSWQVIPICSNCPLSSFRGVFEVEPRGMLQVWVCTGMELELKLWSEVTDYLLALLIFLLKIAGNIFEIERESRFLVSGGGHDDPTL